MVSRAKCKRNSVVIERIPLLNPVARSLMQETGARGGRALFNKVLEVKSCTSQRTGDNVVKHARVVKGRVSGGAVREVRGRGQNVTARAPRRTPGPFPPPPPFPFPTAPMESMPPMMDRGMFDPDPDMTPPPGASPMARFAPAPDTVRARPSPLFGLGCENCGDLGCPPGSYGDIGCPPGSY
jgi:hypothetical protein